MIGEKIMTPFNTNNRFKNLKIIKTQVKIIHDTLSTQIHITHNPHNMTMLINTRICNSIGLNVRQYKKIIRKLTLRFLKKI